MIVLLFLKWFDWANIQKPDVLWYGVAFSFLVDVFLVVALLNWLRTLTQGG